MAIEVPENTTIIYDWFVKNSLRPANSETFREALVFVSCQGDVNMALERKVGDKLVVALVDHQFGSPSRRGWRSPMA